MKKILNILKDSKAFQSLLYNKNDIIVHDINDEALLVASAFLSLDKDIVIVKQNQYEAHQLYE